MSDKTTSAAPTLLVCNCQKSMTLDGDKLARALGLPQPLTIYSELCRSQVAAFEAASGVAGPVRVACTQEAALFREVATERHGEDAIGRLQFVNIRESAGWTGDAASPTAKMVALLAASAHAVKPAAQITLRSQGQCLVYGAGQVALDAARRLASRLNVTLLLTSAGDIVPPSSTDIAIYQGRIRRVSGHLGAFDVEVDGYAPVVPSSRRELAFVMPRDGARSRCDVILDLSGGQPLLGGGHRRDGYLRADPGSPAAVAELLFEASDLVGEFEKPRYVTYDADICAHARSQKVGCTNCLDVCPLGAIQPDGDHVKIDAAVCGGCGSCSAACPTGAVSYDYARREDLLARVQLLLAAYRGAGGARPIVMLHDEATGRDLIGAMARYGKGLPAHVLPLGVYSIFQAGHEILAAMLAAGAEHIVMLASPREADEVPALEQQAELANTFMAGLGYDNRRVHLLVEADPDVVEAALYGLPKSPTPPAAAFAPAGGKREIARMALTHLRAHAPRPADVLSLPAGSPYGRIAIDSKGCTLCLACVGACPANALSDHPDRPEIAFTEAACVQCGVCVATCPERVITLEPRYDFTSAALAPAVLNSQEPAECIRCGKAFGTKATVQKVVERLKGHAMFADEKRLAVIQMCDDCRVISVAEDGIDPFRGAERPRVVTTDDYLEADAAAKKAGRKPEDFLS